MKTKPKQEGWEKELRHIYETAASIDDRSDFDCLLPFIRSLLQKERQRIREEVEKMKVGPWKKWIAATKPYGGTREEWERMQESSHDETLDQVLKLLEDKER